MTDTDTKPCPECGEAIKVTAAKCRFCGEFLDRKLKAAQRRQGSPGGPDRFEVRSSIAIVLIVPGYLVCVGHVCMQGHWYHAPYPVWHYVTEVSWVVAVLVAAGTAIASRTARRLPRTLLLVPLLVSRLLGSAGGALLALELPLLAIGALVALISLGRRRGRASS